MPLYDPIWGPRKLVIVIEGLSFLYLQLLLPFQRGKDVRRIVLVISNTLVAERPIPMDLSRFKDKHWPQ